MYPWLPDSRSLPAQPWNSYLSPNFLFRERDLIFGSSDPSTFISHVHNEGEKILIFYSSLSIRKVFPFGPSMEHVNWLFGHTCHTDEPARQAVFCHQQTTTASVPAHPAVWGRSSPLRGLGAVPLLPGSCEPCHWPRSTTHQGQGYSQRRGRKIVTGSETICKTCRQ